MLLIDPGATSFDLRFRIFGVPVRVHPLFWIFTAILGWNVTVRPILPGNGLLDLAVWVGAVFVSILLHELGHVWMGQVFGSRGHIILYSFGGLAIGTILDSRWKRILVSAAGPGIQLALWGLLTIGYKFGLLDQLNNHALLLLVSFLLWINLVWALLNLLPIWPLDGGQISREICQYLVRRGGIRVSLFISMVTAALIALHALLATNGYLLLPFVPPMGMYSAIFFALFAVSSFQALQEENQRSSRSWEDRRPWE